LENSRRQQRQMQFFICNRQSYWQISHQLQYNSICNRQLFTNFLQASEQFLWCRAFEPLTKEELISRFQNILGENSAIKHYTINLCKIFSSSMQL
jgi:hypothetical protein